MKKCALFLIIMMLVLGSMTGCEKLPTGDPAELISNYYQAALDGDYSTAYSYLSKENAAQITLDQYMDLGNNNAKTAVLLSYQVNGQQLIKDYTYDGVEFGDVYKFTVVTQNQQYSDGKKVSSTSEKYAVGQDGEWKLFDEMSFLEKYAVSLDSVGQNYLWGLGESIDYINAIMYFKKAISIYPDFQNTYYDISVAYLMQNDFENSSKYVDIGLNKGADDNNFCSDLYNVKGEILAAQGNTDGAKEMYAKSLELNPDNAYTEANLKLIQ